jgi:peroxiredoxin
MQLVELQESIGDETAVVAISYDPVEILTGFAANHGITYPLLSDVGSETIASLGMLNTWIEDEVRFWGRESEDKHRGLPLPGVFLLDADGIVAAKHFERSHRNRASAATLLSMLGAPSPSHEISAEGSGPSLAVRVNIHRADVLPQPGVPNRGADGGGTRVPRVSATGSRRLPSALGEASKGPKGSSPKHPPCRTESHSRCSARRSPLQEARSGAVIPTHIHESVGDTELTVVVSYQACDDDTCLIPTEVRVPVELRSRGKL